MPSAMRRAWLRGVPLSGAPVTASLPVASERRQSAPSRFWFGRRAAILLRARPVRALLISAMPAVGGMPLLVAEDLRLVSAASATGGAARRAAIGRKAVAAQIVEHAEAAVGIGIGHRDRLRDVGEANSRAAPGSARAGCRSR